MTIQCLFTLLIMMKFVEFFKFKSNINVVKTTFENDNIIKINNLTKKFKKKKELALSSITFNIEENSFVFLLGHNGAGKSTLINILGNIISKTSGIITKLNSKKIAICYHENSLYSSLTVEENINVFSSIFDFDSKIKLNKINKRNKNKNNDGSY